MGNRITIKKNETKFSTKLYLWRKRKCYFTKKAAVKKAFSTVATLISKHLVSLLDVIE